MHLGRTVWIWSVMGVITLAQPSVANAQNPFDSPFDQDAAPELERGETVLTRSRPELDPLGVPVGSFYFFPKLTLEEKYIDNIFSVESSRNDDFITVVTPEVALESQWGNHELNLTANVSFGRYADFDKENYTDYNFAADGRLDITRESFLFGSVGFTKLHEDRGSPDDVNGSEPTEFDVSLANVQFFHQLNRLSFTVDALVRKFDYDDAPTATTPINNDDRDRLQSDLSIRAGYEIVPEYEAFVRVAVNDRSYDDNVDDNGFDRDSHGFEIVAGTAIDFGGVTFGNVFAGFQYQKFGDSNLKDIPGLTIGADLTWNVTTLTTLKGGITRVIEETTSGGASGFHSTRVRFSVDHELLRNLLLNANLAATQNKYKGIEREDILYELGAHVKYMMNRNFYGTILYGYKQQDSDVAGGGDADYRQNLFMIRLEAQM